MADAVLEPSKSSSLVTLLAELKESHFKAGKYAIQDDCIWNKLKNELEVDFESLESFLNALYVSILIVPFLL
jgi:hypothetical protein